MTAIHFYSIPTQPFVVFFCGTIHLRYTKHHIGIVGFDNETFTIEYFTDTFGFQEITDRRSYVSFVLQALYLNQNVDASIRRIILDNLQAYIAEEVSTLKHNDAVKRLTHYLGLAQACSLSMPYTVSLYDKYMLQNAKDNLFKACIKRLTISV